MPDPTPGPTVTPAPPAAEPAAGDHLLKLVGAVNREAADGYAAESLLCDGVDGHPDAGEPTRLRLTHQPGGWNRLGDGRPAGDVIGRPLYEPADFPAGAVKAARVVERTEAVAAVPSARLPAGGGR